MEAKLSTLSLKRFLLLFVGPSLLLLLIAVAPLISGSGTLYHRDVLSSHFPMKAAQAHLMQDGELPLIDPYRSAGQPLVGNLNAVPLYPDNLLYLVASPLWALNAHFWIHLLLAPLGFYWFGRCWGLSRPAAWAAGICYAASGFFFSLFNLYNLVAGAALVPAFLAAALTLRQRRPPRWAWPAAAVLWALLLLAGDPLFALLGGVMAVTVMLARPHRRSTDTNDSLDSTTGWRRGRVLLPLIGTVAVGTLLAAPQWVEMLRILPLSYRGYWQYSPQAALSQSWDPRTVLEWFVPFAFGAPDFSFWGRSFFGGNPPLLYSLYPGLLCWLLVAASGRPRGAAWWPWWMIGGGLFFASGAHNPLVVALYQVPGAAVLRYPIKMWLLVAVGAALLCGLGFERLLDGRGRRRAVWTTAGLGLFFAVQWIVLSKLPSGVEAWLRGLDPQHLVEPIFTWELTRWRSICFVSLLELGLLALALVLMKRRQGVGGGLLLIVHLALQIFLLSILFDADDIEHYTARPAALASVPENAQVVHGGFHELFGPTIGRPLRLFPDPRVFWLSRSHFENLHPFSGIPWGRQYSFNNSPEGLDSFYSVSMVFALPRVDDATRVQMLRASGVDILLLNRPLEDVSEDAAQLVATWPSAVSPLQVYTLLGPLPDALVTSDVRRAPQMNAALDLIGRPDFDPRTTVVLPAAQDSTAQDPAAPLDEAPSTVVGASTAVGRATITAESTERLDIDVEVQGPSVLVVRRAFQSIYKASVDGVEVPTQVANLHRLAVEVPSGPHRVRFWVDRRPFHMALGVSLLSVLGLGVGWLRRRDNP